LPITASVKLLGGCVRKPTKVRDGAGREESLNVVFGLLVIGFTGLIYARRQLQLFRLPPRLAQLSIDMRDCRHQRPAARPEAAVYPG
jgi:hypothetical protein